MGANLVVASKSDTMQDCMAKMVARDIRHLPVVDEEKGQVGRGGWINEHLEARSTFSFCCLWVMTKDTQACLGVPRQT